MALGLDLILLPVSQHTFLKNRPLNASANQSAIGHTCGCFLIKRGLRVHFLNCIYHSVLQLSLSLPRNVVAIKF